MPIEGFFKTANTFDDWEACEGRFVSFLLRLLTDFGSSHNVVCPSSKTRETRKETLQEKERLLAV